MSKFGGDVPWAVGAGGTSAPSSTLIDITEAPQLWRVSLGAIQAPDGTPSTMNFSSMVSARIDYGVGPVARSVLVDWPSFGQSFDAPAATLRVSAVARPGAGLPPNVGSVFEGVRFSGWAVPSPGGSLLATVTMTLGAVLEGDFSAEVLVPRGARDVTLWYSAFDPLTGGAYAPPLNTARAVLQWTGNMVPGFGLTRYDSGAVGTAVDIGNMSPLASVAVYAPVPAWARMAQLYNPEPAVLLNSALQFRVAL